MVLCSFLFIHKMYSIFPPIFFSHQNHTAFMILHTLNNPHFLCSRSPHNHPPWRSPPLPMTPVHLWAPSTRPMRTTPRAATTPRPPPPSPRRPPPGAGPRRVGRTEGAPPGRTWRTSPTGPLGSSLRLCTTMARRTPRSWGVGGCVIWFPVDMNTVVPLYVATLGPLTGGPQ